MEIRFLSSGDELLEISNIYEKSWKYAYKGIIPQDYLDNIPHGRWADSIGKNGMRSLVMIENGNIIGTASFCRSRWDRYKEYGEIVSIYFIPEYIGKGCGAPLLKRCIGELKLMGFKEILLWVLEDNLRAVRFYERNGFVCSGEYMNDNIGGKDIREVMYTYSIREL